MSIEELQCLPDDDLRHELDEGELITMPPTCDEHGDIEAEIVMRLRSFVKQHSLGKVYTGDVGFVLAKDTLRAPDIAFVRKERAVNRGGFFQGAPDLAVEVFSASDSVPQLMRKVRQYLASGCHTVWIVYPRTKQVHVWEREHEDRILEAGDTLESPELLPGFSIRVSELFE